MSNPHRNRVARAKFRHHAEIDEGHLKLCAFTRINKVAVSQHRRSASDGRALDGGHQWLLEVKQRIHQSSLRRLAWSWRVLEKILDIVARAEGISRAMPQHHAYCVVPGRFVEKIREGRVHGDRHRVFLFRTIQLNAQDVPGMFFDNVAHRPPPATALVGCKSLIALGSKPSSSSTSTLCSPSSGARLAGTFATP